MSTSESGAARNKAVTRTAWDSFAAGDLESVMKDLADDIEWVIPGDSAISGVYRGKDEVANFLMTLGSKGFASDPEHIVAEGDLVVVLARVTVDGQSSDQANVLTFRDGKVAKFQSAGDTALEESIWGRKADPSA
jgi:ketosteroid isomerase-like protein